MKIFGKFVSAAVIIFATSLFVWQGVFAAGVSIQSSTIWPADQVSSVSDDAILKVNLKDESGAPVAGHKLKLISSSVDSRVEEYFSDGVTNSFGEATFRVASSSVGVVTYSVYDVTSDVILADRARVVFFDSPGDLLSGDFAAIGNSSSGISEFAFEDLPSSIEAGESMTFTLTAIDENEQTVLDYTGEVGFEVTAGEAAFVNLPSDYEFEINDLGSHTFSLATSFLQDGSYTVRATDLADDEVFGEQVFVVGNLSSGGGQLDISSPFPGTYSSAVQVISGTAPALAKLKIYDAGIQIGETTADGSGNFSFTTGVLGSGSHSFSVAVVNDIGTVLDLSESVNVEIDSDAPAISQVIIEPSDSVDPGTVVTVRIFTSEDLAQSAIVVDGNIISMQQTAGGIYSAEFAAPIAFGDYPLTIVAVDQLENETRYENEASLNVGGVLTAPPTTALVGDVVGLVAAPGNQRVTLNWNSNVQSTNPLAHYRVYYGTSPDALTQVVDTFTTSNTWYIPGLANGVNYYFAVIAVDDKGNVSERFSNIVEAMPNASAVAVTDPEVGAGIAGEDAIGDLETDPSDAGPEVIWLLFASILGGAFWTVFTGKRREALAYEPIYSEVDRVKDVFYKTFKQ